MAHNLVVILQNMNCISKQFIKLIVLFYLIFPLKLLVSIRKQSAHINEIGLPSNEPFENGKITPFPFPVSHGKFFAHSYFRPKSKFYPPYIRRLTSPIRRMKNISFKNSEIRSDDSNINQRGILMYDKFGYFKLKNDIVNNYDNKLRDNISDTSEFSHFKNNIAVSDNNVSDKNESLDKLLGHRTLSTIVHRSGMSQSNSDSLLLDDELSKRILRSSLIQNETDGSTVYANRRNSKKFSIDDEELRGKDVSSEFHKHQIVFPSLMQSRSKRSIVHTKEKERGHVHHLTLGLYLNGRNVLLDLQLNKDLVSKQYFLRSFRNNSHFLHKQTPEDFDMCYYQGSISGVPNSWAAVSTCGGISGMVFDGENTHFLEPIPGVTKTPSDAHYVLDFRDLKSTNLTCGYKGHSHQPPSKLFQNKSVLKSWRNKRDTQPQSNIRGPFNANPMSRFVELVLVADKAEFEKQGSDVSKIHERFKSIANIMNALYQPLNIFIALVGVEVWEDEDPVEISTDGDKTLTNFLNYRKVRLIPTIPNDNAQLLTGRAFDSGVVGKALKGPICTYQYSGGVSMDHSESVGLVATTVAHEMGHNFGMEHDTEEDCKCPDKRCIMAPSSGIRSPSHWSTCSHEYLAISFERSMDYCLRNKPTTLFDSPICGNGFVEAGEQCDCGLPEHCDNPCCDPRTCMLYQNATCATGHCCDLETCRPKPAGSQCRAALQECDLPEFCSGDAEYCPSDFYKQDGESCQSGKAYCFKGMCRTHDLQCSLLWGPTGKNSHDKCYNLNREGNPNGNCGYNWVNNTYKRCSYGDVKCGMMHCKHFNERLEFGMESVSKVSHRFIADRSQGIIPCRVAQVDLGLDMVDPGLAPDGAKCGYNKMCVDQRCLPVSSFKLHTCDCNGRGVCNNLGHCHCQVGFSWPDCIHPGLGGSEDSGPASNPNATSNFVAGMLVFFLGIVPLVALILFLVYYGKGNLKHWWLRKGRPATSKLSHKENQHRHAPSGPSMKSGTKSDSRLRSDSPPSSDGSKSNSPLLNGRSNRGTKSEVTARLIGKYEGFTLSPIKERAKTETGSNLSKNEISQNVLSTNLTVGSNAGTSKIKPNPLPSNVWPPNSGKTVVVDIGEPSLQACTNPAVKGSASVHVPLRAAPLPPTNKRAEESTTARPKSVPDASVLIHNEPPSSSVSFELSKDQNKRSTVARIASFLGKNEKNTCASESVSVTSDTSQQSNTLPRKASKINKENLLNLEISHPMQLQATELPSNLVPVRSAPEPPRLPEVASSEAQNVTQKKSSSALKVSWAASPVQPSSTDIELKNTENFSRIGSVREPSVTSRPVIPKFGSMRAQRPKSLPPARPSQPPPRPPLPAIPGTPEAEYFYDDCITVQFSPSSKDHQESIYATIDEEESPAGDYSPNPTALDGKKGKRNIFSMLYAKTKKKNNSIESPNTEPLYCNVEESSNQYDQVPDSPDRYSSVITDGASCSSTEDGGLLSEIVSELASREPQYVNTLSSKSKQTSPSKKIISSLNKRATSSSSGSASNSISLADPKSTPVRSKETCVKSSGNLVSYSKTKPRGVFSFFKNSPENGSPSDAITNKDNEKASSCAQSINGSTDISKNDGYIDNKSSLLKESLADVKSVSAETKVGLKGRMNVFPKDKVSSDVNLGVPLDSSSSSSNTDNSKSNRPAFPPDKILNVDKSNVMKNHNVRDKNTDKNDKKSSLIGTNSTLLEGKFRPSVPSSSSKSTFSANPNIKGNSLRVNLNRGTNGSRTDSINKPNENVKTPKTVPEKELSSWKKPVKITSATSNKEEKTSASQGADQKLTKSNNKGNTKVLSPSSQSKNNVLNAAAKSSLPSSSNVASLQQKFEKGARESKTVGSSHSAPLKKPSSSGRGGRLPPSQFQ